MFNNKIDFEELFEKINSYQSKKTIKEVQQFDVLKNYKFFDNLFIETNENIDIYKETLIRRIRTRESWEKQPKQIIEELISSKPLINKFLNQLVEDKERETVKKILRINNILNYDNIEYLASKLFTKILNEKKYIKTITKFIQLLDNSFRKQYKYYNFLKVFKKSIYSFIDNDLLNLDIETETVESFGLFLKYYNIDNLEVQYKFYSLVNAMLKIYNLNVFIVLTQLLINQEERIIETIRLTDKVEEIKKNVNVKNDKFVHDYQNNGKLKTILIMIEKNKDLYNSKNKFLYLEIKDLYSNYF